MIGRKQFSEVPTRDVATASELLKYGFLSAAHAHEGAGVFAARQEPVCRLVRPVVPENLFGRLTVEEMSYDGVGLALEDLADKTEAGLVHGEQCT